MTEQQSKIEWQNSRIAEQQSLDFRRFAGSINGKNTADEKAFETEKEKQRLGIGD